MDYAFNPPVPKAYQHFNPSHITEQNDEESYRPPDSNFKEALPKIYREDSLGPEDDSGLGDD